MTSTAAELEAQRIRFARWLTCLMFFMFAMTSDAVGSVIPKIIAEYQLTLTAAGAFHYVPMITIAIGALAFGFLADRLGRKQSILVGLAIYCQSCLLFAFGDHFWQFVSLLGLAGVGISIFKTGALALIGDVSRSSTEHTSLMNTVEGFFGVGAIVGPAIVATLIARGLSWKWLYVIAALVCALLLVMAALARYPASRHSTAEPVDLRLTLRLLRDRFVLGFSSLVMLYVAVEVAIYVWMPTYLSAYEGPAVWLGEWALTIFFVLRAAGRFLGVWLLRHIEWPTALGLLAVGIFGCFAGSLIGGVAAGVYLLPASGLFMSMMYPTLNSKAISCFPRSAHGSVAGIVLFFTAAAAALGPLAMAAVGDRLGDVKYAFGLATAFAFLLLAGLVYNAFARPADARLRTLEAVA